MNEMVQLLALHGYWLFFAALVARRAGLRVPANLFLLAAGALTDFGRLSFAGILALSVGALLLADSAWYECRRRWGGRTLHFGGRRVCDAEASSLAILGSLSPSPATNRPKFLILEKGYIND
jgi:membrane protein DedA with SNARE-associated domain